MGFHIQKNKLDLLYMLIYNYSKKDVMVMSHQKITFIIKISMLYYFQMWNKDRFPNN